MAHDVFISYAFEDKPTADAVCAELEAAGVRCWVAPRDILPGLVFSEAIIHALNGTRILVLVFSARSNESPHVMREVERAVNRGIPIIPLRIERVALSPSMEYYISTPHWLDALTPPLKKHLVHLAETVRLLLAREAIAGHSAPAAATMPEAVRPTIRPRTALTALSRRPFALGAALIATVAVVAVVASVLGGRAVPAAESPAPGSMSSSAVVVTTPSLGPPATGPTRTQAGTTPSPYVADVLIEPGFAAPGDQVGGIAWDGDDIWVAGGSELFRVDPEGRVLGVFTPPDYTPEGIAWDGSRFWMFATNAGFVYRFTLDESRPNADPVVGKVIDSPIRTIGGGANHGLAWDGSGLWLSDFYNVYRLDTTGKVVRTLAFGDEVNGIAWDGQRLWIAVNHLPADDATLMALDAGGLVTATHEIPLIEVFSMTWAGDAFLIAAAFELAGEPKIYRVAIAGPQETP